MDRGPAGGYAPVMSLARPLLAALLFVAPPGAPSAVAAARHGGNAPTVRAAWARPTMGAAGMSAVYMELVGGARPDTLLGASTPAAGRLELHRSEMKGGMMGMGAAGAVPVPAGGAVSLAPGGLHLMLMDAKRPLRAGDRLPVTLRFAKAGAVRVEVPVRSTAPGR